MEEEKETVVEQLRQLELLMRHASFYESARRETGYDPRRGQGRVLLLLKMKPELTQKELSYLLDMSRQALAELLSKLEKNGYITREPSEKDNRTMVVKLTDPGLKEADVVLGDAAETTKVLDCLSDEELATFSGYLGRIIEAYELRFPRDDFEKHQKIREELLARYGIEDRCVNSWHHHEGRHEGCGRHHGHRCKCNNATAPGMPNNDWHERHIEQHDTADK